MIRDTSAQDRLVEVKPNRKRQLILLGAGVLVLALLAWLAPGIGRLFSASESVSSSRLAFATVERGPFVRDIAAEGKVVAAVSPTLYATSGGAVTLKVHAGDTVKIGQVLATIVSPELTNKLAQEQSNADAMEVEYRRAQIDARKQRSALQETYDNATIDQTTAERNLDRYQKAYTKGAVSNMDVDKANLQRQVDDLNVKSPVDGQVGQLFIAERATVAKDAQLLSVIDLSALQVEMQVPESFARDLGIGMSGEISGNGHTWKGLVSAISPEVVNGQVAARLRFEGETPKQLRQNQRLSVRVLLDKRDNVLTVQRGSFVDESGGSYAYLVRDGIAKKTPIRVGASSIDKVEILEGLKEGDKIVISGTDSFKGAATVAISN